MKQAPLAFQVVKSILQGTAFADGPEHCGESGQAGGQARAQAAGDGVTEYCSYTERAS